MVKYLALAGLSLLPTSPALEQLDSEPLLCPHGSLSSAWSHHTWCHQCDQCPMAHIMTRLPVTSKSQVQDKQQPITELEWEGKASVCAWCSSFVCSVALTIGHYHCPELTLAWGAATWSHVRHSLWPRLGLYGGYFCNSDILILSAGGGGQQ